ncbi:uncharacterized protein N7511_010167 [Penicillium nucicola]|uniref:uncharacterized protein n=1 Tax=Penicillium nucicola TaxID=1850975 RepID=UPI0025451020|nr:uncharacterized protein N7511_010167 [Penicillium nucicola]KAJ5748471.1 hypothetical protein N7511_010167 [Penicillium nucicola]
MAFPVIWIVLFALQFLSVNAHSWVEQLTVIAPNGTFIGNPGYSRGNVLRTAGFVDTMTYLIPPSGQDVTQLLPSNKLCRETQQDETQTTGSPRLQASPGASIALRYQENGHVTLPENQPGKPKNRGYVYVYGTTQPKVGEKLLDVHGKWTSDGTGGDKRGVLLSKQNFDDGRCYQINGQSISQTRQKEFAHTANQLMGADLWCQQDLRLPANAPTGKPYTLYWVWDWPTKPGIDPTYPKGKQEIYTTCMDVDIVQATNNKLGVSSDYETDQDLNNAAIPSQFDSLGKAVPSQQSSQQSSQIPSSVVSSVPTPIMPAVTEWRTVTVTQIHTATGLPPGY